MTRNLMFVPLMTLSMIAATSTGALAQGTYADKAAKQLEGAWAASDGARRIEFKVSNNHPIFEDNVKPGVTFTGGYGPGERGAEYTLEYPERLSCSYKVAFPTGEKGNEMILTLVKAEPREMQSRCIVGTLKRIAK